MYTVCVQWVRLLLYEQGRALIARLRQHVATPEPPQLFSTIAFRVHPETPFKGGFPAPASLRNEPLLEWIGAGLWVLAACAGRSTRSNGFQQTTRPSPPLRVDRSVYTYSGKESRPLKPARRALLGVGLCRKWVRSPKTRQIFSFLRYPFFPEISGRSPCIGQVQEAPVPCPRLFRGTPKGSSWGPAPSARVLHFPRHRPIPRRAYCEVLPLQGMAFHWPLLEVAPGNCKSRCFVLSTFMRDHVESVKRAVLPSVLPTCARLSLLGRGHEDSGDACAAARRAMPRLRLNLRGWR